MSDRGVIVGTDARQEWLLPFWWFFYNSYCSLPVIFADFGMSEEALKFCKKRGKVVPVQAPFKQDEDLLGRTSEEIAEWESLHRKNFWQFRPVYFSKPLALMLAEHPLNLWLDLDVEIRGSLDPLFEQLAKDKTLAVCPIADGAYAKALRKMGIFKPDQVHYNTGVIPFRKECPQIRHWAERAAKDHAKFFTEEHLLSDILYLERAGLTELDIRYNWPFRAHPTVPADVLIVHYVGDKEKPANFTWPL